MSTGETLEQKSIRLEHWETDPWAVPALIEEVKRLRNAVVSIEEYWNGDHNQDALSDAVTEMVSRARDALKTEGV